MDRLASTVIVNGVAYERGTTPPKEVAEKITNPVAWEVDAQESDEPPRTGAGSTTDAWRAYATRLGVEVSDDAGRDDIIAAVDARG